MIYLDAIGTRFLLIGSYEDHRWVMCMEDGQFATMHITEFEKLTEA